MTPLLFRVVKVMNTVQYLPDEVIGIKQVKKLSRSNWFDVTILPKKLV